MGTKSNSTDGENPDPAERRQAAVRLLLRGNERMRSSDRSAAAQFYRKALDLWPECTDALANLSLACLLQGRQAEADTSFQALLAVKPDAYLARCREGAAYLTLKRYEEAEAILRSVVQRYPQYAEAQTHYGKALRHLGRLEEAEAAYRSALALQPDIPENHLHLGDCLLLLGKFDEAEAQIRTALALAPEPVAGHISLAHVLNRQRRFAECDAALQEALALKPQAAIVYSEQSRCCFARGEYSEAITALRQALEFAPEESEIHTRLGMLLLLQGNFEEGWRHYEQREDSAVLRGCVQPQWKGEPLEGKSLLVMAEQGIGDAIQFVRYVPLLKARGAGKVILECPAELRELFRTLSGVDILCVQDLVRMPEQEFDLQVRMMSLPALFGTRLDSIPAPIPYLYAPQERLEIWRQRIGEHDGLKVGIVWAGSAKFLSDGIRSCTPAYFLPLASLPGVTLYSLQKGTPCRQIAPLRSQLPLIDLADDLNDFADTAAAMMQMDLIISVDTSTAHLAGALGRPVWTLLPYSSEWRWLTGRNDSPWYPTMRLFRQTQPFDWPPVLEEVAATLRTGIGCSGIRY